MTKGASNIAVIGAGAWGTALAANQANAGHRVTLWARDANTVDQIINKRSNDRYLPGVFLPETIACTSDLATACTGAQSVLVCIPAQNLSALMPGLAAHLPSDATLISCAKGIDRSSGLTMTQIMATKAPGIAVAVLSGPGFADDVARFLPTAVTLAARDEPSALAVSRQLSNGTLRCYASDDKIGVELGGALKNVLAIAVGVARGRGLGASAEAALVARGFAEMTRVGTALGARAETLVGLSGLGDLVLTCSSAKSRNFAYGVAIGQRQPLDGMKLAEGVHTASIAAKITRRNGIESPLIDAITQVLENRVEVDDAIATLLARPIKGE